MTTMSVRRRRLFEWALSLAAGALVPMPQPVRAQPKRALTLIETHVAGTAYYDAARVTAQVRAGDALVLRREPGNPYDARAIEVLLPGGAKLGYVPRVRNPPFAALMDDGQPLTAAVATARASGSHPDIRFRIALLLPAQA